MKISPSSRLLLVVLTFLGLLAAGWLWLRETPRSTPLAAGPATAPTTESAPLEAGAPPPPPILPGQPTTPIAEPDPPLPAPRPVRAVVPIGAAVAGVPARENLGSAWRTEDHPGITEFNHWAKTYLKADEAGRRALLAAGVALAETRREALTALIKKDPRAAISAAVPLAVRAQLPPAITALLEERVSGVGELALLGALAPLGQAIAEPAYRTATVHGREYRAHVYGRRTAQATKPEISIIGVAVDRSLAVSESPLRVLEAGEAPAADAPRNTTCPLTGHDSPLPAGVLTPNSISAVEVAGKVQLLCQCRQHRIVHVADYEKKLIAAEDAAGPYPGALDTRGAGDARPEIMTAANGQPGTSGVAGRPPPSWSTGTKKVVVIRVDFSDRAGAPVSEALALSLFTNANGVIPFYAQSSYGQAAIEITAADITPVYRLPGTAVNYATNGLNAQLHTDARALATAGGFDLATYDRICVVFAYLGNIPSSLIDYAGLAQVQGRNLWVNGFYDFRVMAHELGHTFGLLHANLWQVADGNPVSDTGSSTEYADPFDTMGGGNTDIRHHFSPWGKSILHWIPDTSVPTITASGTYRLYRFDHAGATTTNNLALKVVRNGLQDYWIGFRQNFATTPSLFNGAYILWGYNRVQQSDLLDMTTPGLSANDAGLAIGSSFRDATTGMTIRPLAKGGVTPNEYLDVVVDFDPFIEWLPPIVSVESNQSSVTLTAKLNRTSTSNAAVSVNYATANGTAVAPTHYTAQSGVFTWAIGDSAPKTITIPIVPNLPFTGVRTFTVTLSNATAGTLLYVPTATVNIGAAGTVDTAFDSEFVDNAVYQTVLQPDGKLLIAGAFSMPNNGFARINPDGTVDAPFASAGGVDVLPVYALVLQPDGKILIGGDFTDVDGTPANGVARLNADGTVDPAFDTGAGPASLGYSSAVRALALQPDGKILVGGSFTSFGGLPREYLCRLLPDGTVDPTFIGPDFSQPYNWKVSTIVIQPDGRILCGGRFFFGAETLTQKSGIIRVLSTGALDTTFDPQRGAGAYANPGWIQEVKTIALQANGQMLIGGEFNGFGGVTQLGNFSRNRLARLNANGSLDSFNPNVDSTFSYPDPASSVNALFLEPGGATVLVGGNFAKIGTTAINCMARLNISGSVDNSFIVGTGTNGEVHDITRQADGKAIFGSALGTVQGIAGRSVFRVFTSPAALPGQIQLSSATASGAEGSSVVITASRTGGSFGALSMNYATQALTAAPTRFTPVAGILSWASGDTTSRTISIPLLNDSIVQPDETLALNLGVPMGGHTNAAPWQTVVTVASGAPLGLWRLGLFTPTQLLDPNISGPSADFDADGLSNVLEFAFGTNPTQAGTATIAVNGSTLTRRGTVTTTLQNIPNGVNFRAIFGRRKNYLAAGLTYTVQFSADLLTWQNSTATPTIVASDAEIDAVTVPYPLFVNGRKTRFFRVQVTSNTP